MVVSAPFNDRFRPGRDRQRLSGHRLGDRCHAGHRHTAIPTEHPAPAGLHDSRQPHAAALTAGTDGLRPDSRLGRLYL